MVGVESEIEQQAKRLDVFLHRSFVGDALNPADAAGRGQRVVTVRGDDRGIRLVLEQQLHQLGVARLRGTDEGGRAILEEPLHREDGSRQRVVFRARIGMGAVFQKELDVVEMIDVRFRNRKISAFDIAVIDRNI